MFCPSCSSYLFELQLIKSNAKYMPGTREPIEYDARCPVCNKEIGRMSWGQLTIAPGLERKREAISLEGLEDGELDLEEEAAPTPEEELAGVAPEIVETETEAPPAPKKPPVLKFCPHCGKPLPED